MASLKDMMYPPVDWNDPYAKGEVAPPQSPGLMESPADRLYKQLMAEYATPKTPDITAMPQPKKPGYLDRLRGSLVVPSAPTHYKQRKSQEFLRGLVQGFKGPEYAGRDGGAKGSSASAVGPDGLTAYQRASLKYRASADERANATQERLAKALEFSITDRNTDNARQAEQFKLSREDEAFDRDMARRGMSIRERELALAQRREQRIAEADKVASGGVNPKWPESWKREYAGLVDGLKQRLTYQKDYTPDDYLRDLRLVADVFAEREFRLMGGQTGSSTTAPVRGR